MGVSLLMIDLLELGSIGGGAALLLLPYHVTFIA